MGKPPFNPSPPPSLINEPTDAISNLKRIAMNHREIYLTDARKTTPDKNKTVLRFKVKHK